MTEYGIFNDEGCIDRGFYCIGEAVKTSLEYIEAGEENVSVAELCLEHDIEQSVEDCEECWAEEGEEDE